MRGKFAFAVVLLAAVAWLAAESTSYAGRCHRRARRGGCHTTYSGCGSYGGCGQAYSGCGQASSGCGDCYSGGTTAYTDGQDMPPAPPAPNAGASPSDGAPAPPPAPDQGAQAEPSPEAPAVQAGTTQSTGRTYYTGSRRARRGWFRR